MDDWGYPGSRDFEAGSLVAGYRLGEQVGWGGMAAVYRAYQVRLGRWVALKILAPEMASDASFRQRFISESRMAAAVDHPHIIPVFEAGEAGGVLFIAMRYVGAGDVRMLVGRLGPLEAARAGRIIAQVASALDAAHAAGLVHGDVKPANMLLGAAAGGGYPDHVYLADFGLSRQARSAAGTAVAGQLSGPPDHRARGRIDVPPAGSRADLHALARAAYEMLAGQATSGPAGDPGRPGHQPAGSAPPLSSLRPDLPPGIDLVLARAVAGSPDDGYESCRDFAASLLQACGLEWSASGEQLTGPPGAVMPLAAPLVPAGAPATRDRADSAPATRDHADSAAAIRDHAVEPAWPQSLLPLMSGEPGPGPASPAPPQPAGPQPAGPQPAWPEPAPPKPGLADLAPAAGRPDWLAQDGPGPYPRARRARLPGKSLVIAVAALVVILAVAGSGFLALRSDGRSPFRHSARALPFAATSPAPPGSAGRTANPERARVPGRAGRPPRARVPGRGRDPRRPKGPGGAGRRPAAPAGPAGTVTAYIAAINRHDYARAWDLGGRNSSATYQAFVQGFSTTAKDTLVILAASGNVVTIELVAQQDDGTVITYQGTYTVDDGVITSSHIEQIS